MRRATKVGDVLAGAMIGCFIFGLVPLAALIIENAWALQWQFGFFVAAMMVAGVIAAALLFIMLFRPD